MVVRFFEETLSPWETIQYIVALDPGLYRWLEERNLLDPREITYLSDKPEMIASTIATIIDALESGNYEIYRNEPKEGLHIYAIHTWEPGIFEVVVISAVGIKHPFIIHTSYAFNVALLLEY